MPFMTEPSGAEAADAAESPRALRHRLRDALLAPVLPCALFVVVHLPRGLLQGLGQALGALYRLGAPRERRILRRNLRRVLDVDPGSEQGRRLEREVFTHQALATLEAVSGIWRPERVVVEGLGFLRAAFTRAEAEGRGQILVTAHLGSWELISRYAALVLDGTFHELAKPPRVRPARRLLERVRERAGSRVLWTEASGTALLREMIGVLRSGDTLGFAMDQKPEGLRGPAVDFFGQLTEFVPGPAALAVKTRAAVIAVFCVRLGPFCYRLKTVEVLPSGHRERDAHALTQRLATVIEEAIVEDLTQWPWNYRRWVFDDEPWTGRRGRDRVPEGQTETDSASET